ncbi:MAG: transcriptional regulator [Cyanobacteria bacterium]|nr:transcriptional regulator [Cyanobacteriota bacterium]
MTPTISTEIRNDRYGNLLAEYQPRIIKTEEENDRFLAIVEDLMHRSLLSPEEDALLDLLVKLIEDFETEHYHLDVSTPRSRLLHLMEARDLEANALIPLLGDRTHLLLSGESELSLEDAIVLAPFFHVKPELFLS